MVVISVPTTPSSLLPTCRPRLTFSVAALVGALRVLGKCVVRVGLSSLRPSGSDVCRKVRRVPSARSRCRRLKPTTPWICVGYIPYFVAATMSPTAAVAKGLPMALVAQRTSVNAAGTLPSPWGHGAGGVNSEEKRPHKRKEA